MLIALATALAALWHVLAFSIGFGLVILHVRALFRFEDYDNRWSRPLRAAELHLWLSGLAIIGAGIAQSGLERYAANPKLWAKISVVLIWAASVHVLRSSTAAWLQQGQRRRVIAAASISVACWLYAAFLGCAKDLAFGVAPFSALMAGFIAAVLMGLIAGLALEQRYGTKAG